MDKRITYAVGGALLAVLVGGGAYLFVQHQEQEMTRARVAEEQRARDAQERLVKEERKRLEALIRERQAKVDALLKRLQSAKDDTERAQIQKELDAERDAQKKLTGTPKSDKRCACEPGDPLCSCP